MILWLLRTGFAVHCIYFYKWLRILYNRFYCNSIILGTLVGHGSAILSGIHSRFLKLVDSEIFKFDKNLWNWLKNWNIPRIACLPFELRGQNENTELRGLTQVKFFWNEIYFEIIHLWKICQNMRKKGFPRNCYVLEEKYLNGFHSRFLKSI